MFTLEHLRKMREGVRLFNEQKYWECHEALEDIWAEDAHDKVRNVYWAIIQVAASCIHYRDKNLVGALGMITKAKEKFRRVRELSIYTPLLNESLDWDELESIVMAIPENPELADFAKLFNFRFKNYPETSI